MSTPQKKKIESLSDIIKELNSIEGRNYICLELEGYITSTYKNNTREKNIYTKFINTLTDDRNRCDIISINDADKFIFVFGDLLGKTFATDSKSYFIKESKLQEVFMQMGIAMNKFIAETLDTKYQIDKIWLVVDGEIKYPFTISNDTPLYTQRLYHF